MSGKTFESDKELCLSTLERNLRYALPELERRGVIGLVKFHSHFISLCETTVDLTC